MTGYNFFYQIDDNNNTIKIYEIKMDNTLLM